MLEESTSSDTDFFSLFGIDEPATQGTVIPDPDTQFWIDLHTQIGLTQLGCIEVTGGLTFQLQSPGKNNKGMKYAVAIKTPRGYRLDGTDEPTNGSVPLYFLPWKQNDIVYAERSWYEKSACEYFLTSKLTGCRFVLTSTRVLHVASNHAGIVSENEARLLAGSETIAKISHAKDLPFNGAREAGTYGSKHPETGAAFVFGMKKDGIWSYKVLKCASDSDASGSWERLI